MNMPKTKCQNKRLAAITAATLGLMSAVSVTRADLALAWGQNNYGQLGNGSNINAISASTITGLSTGVSAVAAGTDHGLAIQNGAVLAWGYNSNGQLGNGSTTDTNAPVAVNGLTSGVTAVAAGGFHSLAIRNGAALAWGANDYDQLGNGSNADSSTPVAVANLSSGVTAVAAGYRYSLAIQNGAAKAWGYDFSNQLGIGPPSDYYFIKPVNVHNLSSGVTAIAAGFVHSLAVQNGAAMAWGDDDYGELGDGRNSNSAGVPVSVIGLTTGVTAVAAGLYTSLAIQNGNVYAWGLNNDGQLGNGSTEIGSPTPVLALDTPANIVAIAAAEYSSYAVSSDGSLWVWGDNAYGELGLGTATAQYNTPQHRLPPAGFVFTGIDADANGLYAVATLTAVPEPATLTAIALPTIILLTRRKTYGIFISNA